MQLIDPLLLHRGRPRQEVPVTIGGGKGEGDQRALDRRGKERGGSVAFAKYHM